LHFATEGDAVMVPWEVALLPPLFRFFLGFFLVLIITGGTVILLYWMARGEEE
jgi:hypothetical protein